MLSYSYLGRSSQYDPPDTYAIVSKDMPLPMADLFIAVVLFLIMLGFIAYFLRSMYREETAG